MCAERESCIHVSFGVRSTDACFLSSSVAFRDGIETARRLRELCVPVVFVTAYSDEDGIVERIRQQVPDAEDAMSEMGFYVCGVASTQSRACSLAASEQPDFVLMDAWKAVEKASKPPEVRSAERR